MLSRSVKIIGFVVILYAAYLLILLALPYLALKPGVEFLSTKQFVYHLKSWRWSFYLHVFSSSFILIFGLFQFNRYVIHRKPVLHRFFGYTYTSLLLIVSGPASLIMSLYANGGIPAQISFTLLSVLWIFSTLYALILALRKEFEKHGRWILRSYALTLSAVTLRFYAYLFDVFRVDLDPVSTYILLSYLGWIPNLIVAEIMIRKGFIRNLLSVRRR